MLDLGIVLYQIADIKGTLTAKYLHNTLGFGTGIAEGNQSNGF